MAALARFQQLSPQAWVWLGGGGWGHPNSGLIAQGSSGLLVNTQHDRKRTDALIAAAAESAPNILIDRVLITDASPHHQWGLDALPEAEVLVSNGTSTEMAGQMSPAELAGIIDGLDPDLPLARYLHQRYGGLDLAGVWPLIPAGSFSGRTSLHVGTAMVELIDCGPAYSEADTVAWLPSEGVLFTGDLLCLGVHPAVRSGSFGGWRDACAKLAAMRPERVVPGHGPVTDIAGIIDFRDYLDHLRQEVHHRYSKGMPVEDTVMDLPMRHWADWTSPENLVVTVATLYGQLGDEDPASFTEITTLAAEIAVGLRVRPRIPPLAPGDRDTDTVKRLGLTDGEAAIFEFHKANVPNVISTLARHGELLEATVPIARGVVSGILPGRDREMVILRGAWNCAAVYQWSHHRHMALSVGLTESEIDLLSKEISHGAWTTREATLLRAADELHKCSTLTDETWALLEGHYGEKELIELVTLVGEYHKISFQLNAWRVPVEQWTGPIRLPSGWPDA